MKQLRSLKKWVSDYNEAQQLTEDLEVLLEFYKAGEIEEAELASNHNKLLDLFEEIEFRNMVHGALNEKRNQEPNSEIWSIILKENTIEFNFGSELDFIGNKLT